MLTVKSAQPITSHW